MNICSNSHFPKKESNTDKINISASSPSMTFRSWWNVKGRDQREANKKGWEKLLQMIFLINI